VGYSDFIVGTVVINSLRQQIIVLHLPTYHR